MRRNAPPAAQFRPRETTSLLASPAQSPREGGAIWSERAKSRWPARLADALGLKDAAEARIVSRLILMGALANIAFVYGRNAGPALYVHVLGSRRLARAMFLSALTICAVTPRFSTYARPRRAVRIYASVQLAGAALLLSLWVMLLNLHQHPGPPSLATQGLYTLFFVCEDLTTLLVMMQNGAVVQELFTATAARRVVGLVQLGSSLGAVFAGLTCGGLSSYLGANSLVLAQVVALLLGLPATGYVANVHVEKSTLRPGPSTTKWWTDDLVLGLGVYTVLVIAVKTTLEYCYTCVIAKDTRSPEAMVTVTGYLYAAAGVAASVLNAGGTRRLLRRFGLAVSAAYPLGVALLLGVICIQGASVESLAAARAFDLAARWSVSNTFKSVLWIAVDLPVARAARPYVESLAKKATAAVVALVLGYLTTRGFNIAQLCALALISCALLTMVGFQLRLRYLAAMRRRVARRSVLRTSASFVGKAPLPGDQAWGDVDEEGHLVAVEADVRDATSAGDGRDALAELVFERFRRGGVGAKLFLLREIGAGVLRPREVRELFLAFDAWEPSVRVAALRDVIASLDKEEEDRDEDVEAPVLNWADALVLRELEQGDPLAETPDDAHVSAAAALLSLGWGIGMGHVSSGAAKVLESMLGGHLQASKPQSLRQLAAARPALDASRLAAAAGAAQSAWDKAVQDGDEGAAVAAAIRLTACRVAARGGAEAVAVVNTTFALDATAAAAALHALRDTPFLTPDMACWLRLAQAEDPRVSRALLALAPPTALGPDARAHALAKLAGARPTARRAARLLSADAAVALAAAPRLLDALERSMADDDDRDAGCLLDALRAVTAFAGRDGASARAWALATSTDDAVYEGLLLDFVRDCLDAGASLPSPRAVEDAVRREAAEADTAAQARARFLRLVEGRYPDRHVALAVSRLRGDAVDDLGTADDGVALELGQVAAAYAAEKLYGRRQHLLARCALLARGSRRWRPRDAWKVLRDDDPKAASAVLELVEADLPPALKPCVLGALSSTKSRAASVKGAVRWLEAQGDALGSELANAVDALCSGRAAPIAKGALLPRVALLTTFAPLEHALLAQHLAPLAALCSWRRYALGDAVDLAATESAVVAKGVIAVAPAVLERGGALQPWHALGGVAGWAAIAPTQVHFQRPSDACCSAPPRRDPMPRAGRGHAALFRVGARRGRLTAVRRRVVAEVRLRGAKGVGRRIAGAAAGRRPADQARGVRGLER